MPIAVATVATERPSRYLVQLCRHVEQVAWMSPSMRARVEWTDENGVIDFGWGRCMLRTVEGGLTLRAEANEEQSLGELTRRVAGRLEQVGARDQLRVVWDFGEPTGSRQDDRRGDFDD